MKNHFFTRTVITALAVFGAFMTAPTIAAAPLVLHVAPDGRDTWSGSRATPNRAQTDGPLATLEKARDVIRSIKQRGALPAGGVRVEMAAGIYSLARPFALEAQDSGTQKAPIEYAAQRGAKVRIIGGKIVSGWKKVTDAAQLSRLEPEARTHVWQADLGAQGLTDLPGPQAGANWGQSAPGAELFQNRPMTLARWPNDGTVQVVDVVNGTPEGNNGVKSAKEGKIIYGGDRPKRWTNESDIWLHGYWSQDWADQRQKVASIDTDTRLITLAGPPHAFGYRTGQWFYAFNVFAELDAPGEWFLDHKTNILYFWPPAPLEQNPPVVSVLPTLVTLQNVAYTTLRGLTLEAAQGTAVRVDGGNNVRISGCVVRNVGDWAVEIKGATNSGVVGCDIYDTGAGGVSLESGDRKTLTPGGLFAENNHIHHYSRWNPVYNAGVRLNGVGNRASHNLIHDAPHMAIGFGGNDHVIEYNEIHNVCLESNDAGVMYAGQHWDMRGSMVRYNYLHHIYGRGAKGCMGVYLDDNFSGTTILGNVFFQVPRAAFLGGGRDNIVENNVFVDCTPAVNVDARGLGWRAYGKDDLTKKLEEMPYKEDPWRSRYPQLLTLLTNDPMAPVGTVVARNICVGGQWSNLEKNALPFITLTDNFTEGDPLVADPAHHNFALRPDSLARKKGVAPIPFDKIGLQPGSERASWPVVHPVQPKPEPAAKTAQP